MAGMAARLTDLEPLSVEEHILLGIKDEDSSSPLPMGAAALPPGGGGDSSLTAAMEANGYLEDQSQLPNPRLSGYYYDDDGAEYDQQLRGSDFDASPTP